MEGGSKGDGALPHSAVTPSEAGASLAGCKVRVAALGPRLPGVLPVPLTGCYVGAGASCSLVPGPLALPVCDVPGCLHLRDSYVRLPAQ